MALASPLAPAALARDAALLLSAATIAAATRASRRVRLQLALGVIAITSVAWIAYITHATSTEPADKPDLVLVIIDTLRDDVFRAVVHETEEGRRFAAAVPGAAWFSHTIATAPWTLPAVGSIMTGLHPAGHGLQRYPGAEISDSVSPLVDSARTLAEELTTQGYRTEAILANVFLLPSTGLGRGFDCYDLLDGGRWKLPLVAWLQWLKVTPNSPVLLRAQDVRVQFANRLGALAGNAQPLFFWLHLMEPHEPLQPQVGLSPDPVGERLPPLERLYRDNVRHALDEVAQMIQLINEHGRWARTVFILTADHGEMFPSDDRQTSVRYGHGHALYEELIHVPLVIHPAGGLPTDRAIDALNSHVDLFDTVAELLRLPRAGHAGNSLAPWLSASAAPSGPAPLASVIAGSVASGPDQRTLRTDRFKVIEFPNGEQPDELYDLAADPGERQNLAGSRPDVLAQSLESLRGEWAARSGVATASRHAIDPATSERLKALGYVN
ncbi:MAG TPA: sulfatase-like hydrolase/transferase [Candidatus Binatia bacterium]|nr:sulfatase-like hydrolase/transferase [Candidatus Binatia bacterium]